jgi:hypothetical protein
MMRPFESIRHSVSQNSKVQELASVESLRRFLWLTVFTIPMHFVLAWWFNRYQTAATPLETMEWAHALRALHGITGAIVLTLACFVRWVVRPTGRATLAGIALHILLCITYLAFGVAASLLDVNFAGAGGISPYIIVCITMGVISLMSPAISIALFSGAFLTFWGAIAWIDFTPAMLANLLINSIAATAMSLIASVMHWNQYVKITQLQEQLGRANQIIGQKYVPIGTVDEHHAPTLPPWIGPRDDQ